MKPRFELRSMLKVSKSHLDLKSVENTLVHTKIKYQFQLRTKLLQNLRRELYIHTLFN
jgi:hypothetical protein